MTRIAYRGPSAFSDPYHEGLSMELTRSFPSVYHHLGLSTYGAIARYPSCCSLGCGEMTVGI